MTFTEYSGKLERIKCLARNKQAGTPQHLAAKLDVSERTVQRMVQHLREQGCPIIFNRYRCTYYNNPLEITYADGTKEKWTRDDLDLVLTHTDELGRVTRYTRDNKHRITRIDYPDGTNEQVTYNNFSQVVKHTLKNGGIEDRCFICTI